MNRILSYLNKAFNAVVALLARPVMNLFPPPVKEVIRDIPYAERLPKQALDVIVPEGSGPFPVLVYLHGGGFASYDKGTHERIAKVFASRGFLVVNCNYRLAPRHAYPLQIQDLAGAVAWTMENASRHGGDPRRLFLGGDSAGAYLVSIYACALDSPELAAAFGIERLPLPSSLMGLLLFYGAYDCETVLESGFPFIRTLMGAFLGNDPVAYRERSRVASPVRHLHRSYPPCFLVAAERDPLYAQTRDMERELAGQGVPVSTLYLPRTRCRFMPHGFLNLFWRGCARDACSEAVDFMGEQLQSETPEGDL